MQASLTLPPEVILVSGENPIYIGNVSQGESRTVSWTVVFTAVGVFVLEVNATGYRHYAPIFETRLGFANVTATTVRIASPQNVTYNADSVPLIFYSSSDVDWIGYSLDGIDNQTINQWIMLTELAEGSHTVEIFANTTTGDIGSAETYFTVDTESPNITAVSQTPEDNVEAGYEVSVNATVIDLTSGVESVTLNYNWINNGEIGSSNLSMTKLSENIWNAVIPAFQFGTNVSYSISALDYAGNLITTDELGYNLGYPVITEFSSVAIIIIFLLVTLTVTTSRKCRC